MKLVIDTSVLIAAMIGNPLVLKIFDFVCKEQSATWHISRPIYNEYKLIINRDKFSFSDEQKLYWRALIKSNAILEVPESNFHFSRDISDSKFIQLAVSTKADYLLTYDKLLLGADFKIETSIIEPEIFVENLHLIGI